FLMSFGRVKLSMYSLVGEVGKKGINLIPIVQPVQRVIDQQIRSISLDLPALTVNIQRRVVVYALALKTYPSIKTRLRIVTGPSHMPLTEEGGLIAFFL